MSQHPVAAKVGKLGQEGARLLTREPALAAAKFEEAHYLALQSGMILEASKLSSLVARCWHLLGSSSRCLYFSRRAVRDMPEEPSAHSTLGHFLENAAFKDARAGKLRRSVHLFTAAAKAYEKAAEMESDPRRAATMSKIAEDIEQKAQEVFEDWWNGQEAHALGP